MTHNILQYDPASLKSFAASPLCKINRNTRKVLFRHKIWRPNSTASDFLSSISDSGKNHNIPKPCPTRKYNFVTPPKPFPPWKCNSVTPPKPFPPRKCNSVTPPSTKMCVINAQSCRAKSESLLCHLMEDNIDILAITETWLQDH